MAVVDVQCAHLVPPDYFSWLGIPGLDTSAAVVMILKVLARSSPLAPTWPPELEQQQERLGLAALSCLDLEPYFPPLPFVQEAPPVHPCRASPPPRRHWPAARLSSVSSQATLHSFLSPSLSFLHRPLDPRIKFFLHLPPLLLLQLCLSCRPSGISLLLLSPQSFLFHFLHFGLDENDYSFIIWPPSKK